MSSVRLAGMALRFCAVAISESVTAQSISISPKNPQPGQPITVTFNAPDGCALNAPVLQAPPPGPKWANFIFVSINTLGVLCPAIPQPFSYTTAIGPLGVGAYSIEWQDYSAGSKIFDVVLPFNVAAAKPSEAPALSWSGLAILTILICSLARLGKVHSKSAT